MRSSVFAALAALVWLAPGLAPAQDAGPDSGMLAESRAAASQSARPDRAGQPTLSERAAAGSDEGLRVDPDCDTHPGGPASTQPGESGGQRQRRRARRPRPVPQAEGQRHRHRPDRRGPRRHPPHRDHRRPADRLHGDRRHAHHPRRRRQADRQHVLRRLHRPAMPHRPVTFLYNGGPGSSTHVAAHGLAGARPGADRQPAAHPQRALRPGRTTTTACWTSPTWCSSTRSAPASRGRSATPSWPPSGAPTRTSTPSPAASSAG